MFAAQQFSSSPKLAGTPFPNSDQATSAPAAQPSGSSMAPWPDLEDLTTSVSKGKGIVLLHDFHRHTAEAMPQLLLQLKLAGYKIVHMVPKEQLNSIPKYDEMLDHRESLSSRAQQGYAAAPGNVAATHRARTMYMYVPAHRNSTQIKKDQKTPTTGATDTAIAWLWHLREVGADARA
jgi:hypothetical protein